MCLGAAKFFGQTTLQAIECETEKLIDPSARTACGAVPGAAGAAGAAAANLGITRKKGGPWVSPAPDEASSANEPNEGEPNAGPAGRAGPQSGGTKGSGSGSKSGSGTPPWVNAILKIMCPQDKAFLQDLKNRGVTITAYDQIYFDDPYYNGSRWTTRRFNAGGTTVGKNINIIRSPDAADNAGTIYHEGIHTGQPQSMSWRDMEYDAYAKGEGWAIAHGLPPHDPSFRTTDAAGNQVPNVAAIKAFVDREYPGVTTASGEQVVGKDSNGNAIVERADGTTYTRPPQAGDSYSGREVKQPPSGIKVDMSQLQCP